MGRDLQTKNLTCLHVLTVSPYKLQELKGKVLIVIFAVEMLDNTLTKEFKVNITPGSGQCVFLNVVP